MRYPVVTFEDGQEYVLKRKQRSIPVDETPRVHLRETGDGSAGDVEDLIWDQMLSLQDAFHAKKDAFRGAKRDALEGLLVEPLHMALKHLPVAVLTDRDFHRYLSVRWLMDFAIWRDRKNDREDAFPSDDSFGVSSRTLHSDTISLRMINRALISEAAAAEGEDPYAIARHGAGDIWKSHILRTLNSEAPLVVKEMIEGAQRKEFGRDVVREFAKRVKRLRANILLDVLVTEDAQAFVQAQRVATVAALDELPSAN